MFEPRLSLNDVISENIPTKCKKHLIISAKNVSKSKTLFDLFQKHFWVYSSGVSQEQIYCADIL